MVNNNRAGLCRVAIPLECVACVVHIVYLLVVYTTPLQCLHSVCIYGDSNE